MNPAADRMDTVHIPLVGSDEAVPDTYVRSMGSILSQPSVADHRPTEQYWPYFVILARVCL
ncbi:hypothetical protein ABIE67_005559 [Streptomyces sp. V4I8]|uniref:hypothetical protein n=1 Tax=Streptomyces sp. V4I8 TaxID=3156469 RepID=UPI003516E5A9